MFHMILALELHYRLNMKFVQNDRKVNINGKEFDLELFLSVEPDYEMRDGWFRIYEPDRRHIVTNGRATIQKTKRWNDGDRYLTRVSDLIYLKAYLDSEK